MFDIKATKRRLGIGSEKTESETRPRAIHAIRAIPEALKENRSQQGQENSTNSTNSTGVPFENENVISIIPFYVHCIECTYFERIDHPHLGRCGAGVKSAAASSLFWSTDARGCDKFTETEGMR